MTRRKMLGLAASGVALTGCGYHVAGKADLMPKNIRTIAVPPFANPTTRYRLTELLPAAITHELIARTRYQVVPEVEGADAVLRGSVLNFFSYGSTVDPATGRASSVQVSAILQVSLVERATGKVLFNRPSFEYKQRYEVSVLQADPTDQKLNRNVYFDESEAALERMSRELARSVVTGILENF